MTLSEMMAVVRQDLHDEDPGQYRWRDEILSRHIDHAVKDFSLSCPLEQWEVFPTVAGSREIDISILTDRVSVDAVEYPAGHFPQRHQTFSLWANILTLLGGDEPDGTDCNVYYTRLHTLDEAGSTVPDQYADLIVAGACGYAAVELAGHTINRVNVGGTDTMEELTRWGNQKLDYFRQELKRIGRKNRVRVRQLYNPHYPVKSPMTDQGPG
jgi:hypothetical protein